MPIGYESTLGAQNLNAMLGSAALARRDAAEQALRLWSAVSSLGTDEQAQVAALTALGFTAGDAQDYWTAANYLYADAQFYYGDLATPQQFSYDQALAPVRAGQ